MTLSYSGFWPPGFLAKRLYLFIRFPSHSSAPCSAHSAYLTSVSFIQGFYEHLRNLFKFNWEIKPWDNVTAKLYCCVLSNQTNLGQKSTIGHTNSQRTQNCAFNDCQILRYFNLPVLDGLFLLLVCRLGSDLQSKSS